MHKPMEPPPKRPIHYSDRDGKRMADYTLQFQYIVTIKEGLEWMFRDRPDVFVAGDLLWYPVEGNNKIRTAPDAMVVFGRGKGHRGSYQQWLEGGIAPQVVFEVTSPGNRRRDMERKFNFYQTYGVEEYYCYDPDRGQLYGWQRQAMRLAPIEPMQGWTSPRLGVRMELAGVELKLYGPDGLPFATYAEMGHRAEQAIRQRDAALQRANQMAELLRSLGVEPPGP